jgi:hypothetical protein
LRETTVTNSLSGIPSLASKDLVVRRDSRWWASLRSVATERVSDLEACKFYHSIELPNYGLQHGEWDLRGRFDDYTAGVPLDGRTVLDVGSATGFLTFEAEKRGAAVTSFDASSVDQFHQLPVQTSEFVRNHDCWRAEMETWIEKIRNGYWLCHRDLASQARCVYGNVYDIDAENTGAHEVVIVGQILIHLRDALTALAATASVCTDTIVITEGSFDNDTPIAALAGRADKPELAYAWYQYSHGWYREVLTMLGFHDVQITTDTYSCRQEDHAEEIALATIVGTRHR